MLGLIVAYMVLATQFNAFTHPFTVLLALPFSVSGALLALWLAGQSMNVYSMLGIILLMGIAKKNSIMLVDFTNQLREQGAERHEALLEACPIRLRPILMTSIATIAGALPARPRHRSRGRAAAAHGPRPRGRHDRVHRVHPARGALGLQPHRRRGGLERGAAEAWGLDRGRPAGRLRAPRGHLRFRDLTGVLRGAVVCPDRRPFRQRRPYISATRSTTAMARARRRAMAFGAPAGSAALKGYSRPPATISRLRPSDSSAMSAPA